jgi:hypothetical protein
VEAVRGGAPGTRDGTRATACTGPWPDPYRHAPRVTPAVPLPTRTAPAAAAHFPARPDGPGVPFIYPPAIVGGIPPVQSFRAQNAIRIRILNYGACMGVIRARYLPTVSGPVLMRKTRRGRDLGNFGPPFGPANWRVSPGSAASRQHADGHPKTHIFVAGPLAPGTPSTGQSSMGRWQDPARCAARGPRQLANLPQRRPPSTGVSPGGGRPAEEPSPWAAAHEAPANWRILAAQPAPRGLPGTISRSPTGECAPAEHNGLAPVSSPLPSRHPALPDP